MAGEQDLFTDPQVAALIALVTGAVNADLGIVAIAEATDHPVNVPGDVGTQSMPLASIYRISEIGRRRTSDRTETVAQIRFEYYASPTPRLKPQDRWPILRRVWRSAWTALVAGAHPAVSGGAGVLAAAGIATVEDANPAPSVAYSWAEPGKRSIPRFVANFQIEHQEIDDVAALVDLLSLDASYDLVGLEAGEQPLVREIIEIPQP